MLPPIETQNKIINDVQKNIKQKDELEFESKDSHAFTGVVLTLSSPVGAYLSSKNRLEFALIPALKKGGEFSTGLKILDQAKQKIENMILAKT